VQGNAEFDGTEIGGKVDGAVIVEPTECVPNFGGKLLKLIQRELL